MDYFLQGWPGASPAIVADLMGVLAAAAVFSGLSGFGMSACRHVGSLSLLVLPGVLAGNALGLALFKKTSDIGYRRITLGALGVVGMALVWRGV